MVGILTSGSRELPGRNGSNSTSFGSFASLIILSKLSFDSRTISSAFGFFFALLLGPRISSASSFVRAFAPPPPPPPFPPPPHPAPHPTRINHHRPYTQNRTHHQSSTASTES